MTTIILPRSRAQLLTGVIRAILPKSQEKKGYGVLYLLSLCVYILLLVGYSTSGVDRYPYHFLRHSESSQIFRGFYRISPARLSVVWQLLAGRAASGRTGQLV